MNPVGNGKGRGPNLIYDFEDFVNCPPNTLSPYTNPPFFAGGGGLGVGVKKNMKPGFTPLWYQLLNLNGL